MDSETRQRGNAPGITARTVARNISRVRTARGVSQQELSERLGEIGRPIPTSSVGKIESGLRSVDVDDLMAIAVALDVSPLGLLIPRSPRAEDQLAVTGAVQQADRLWAWAVGNYSVTAFELPQGQAGYNQNNVTDLSLPRWLNLPVIIGRNPVGGPEDESTPRRWPFERVESDG